MRTGTILYLAHDGCIAPRRRGGPPGVHRGDALPKQYIPPTLDRSAQSQPAATRDIVTWDASTRHAGSDRKLQ